MLDSARFAGEEGGEGLEGRLLVEPEDEFLELTDDGLRLPERGVRPELGPHAILVPWVLRAALLVVEGGQHRVTLGAGRTPVLRYEARVVPSRSGLNSELVVDGLVTVGGAELGLVPASGVGYARESDQVPLLEAVGVRIYTIGAGSEGTITQRVDGGIFGPRYQRIRVEIDEETLKEVAKTTGGRYYRATSEQKLEEIYREIGEMEKTEIKTRDYVEYEELFPFFLLPALGILALEILLAHTRFRRLP